MAWILIDRKLNRILNTPLFVALNMDIDTINALSDTLCWIHLSTLSWDDGKLGDQEAYNACDEMRAICIAILTNCTSRTMKMTKQFIVPEPGLLYQHNKRQYVQEPKLCLQPQCLKREGAG
jgi:hypothetical protein